LEADIPEQQKKELNTIDHTANVEAFATRNRESLSSRLPVHHLRFSKTTARIDRLAKKK
jgi:hypothetical protein